MLKKKKKSKLSFSFQELVKERSAFVCHQEDKMAVAALDGWQSIVLTDINPTPHHTHTTSHHPETPQ